MVEEFLHMFPKASPDTLEILRFALDDTLWSTL